jgi:hypothetical protein
MARLLFVAAPSHQDLLIRTGQTRNPLTREGAAGKVELVASRAVTS